MLTGFLAISLAVPYLLIIEESAKGENPLDDWVLERLDSLNLFRTGHAREDFWRPIFEKNHPLPKRPATAHWNRHPCSWVIETMLDISVLFPSDHRSCTVFFQFTYGYNFCTSRLPTR